MEQLYLLCVVLSNTIADCIVLSWFGLNAMPQEEKAWVWRDPFFVCHCDAFNTILVLIWEASSHCELHYFCAMCDVRRVRLVLDAFAIVVVSDTIMHECVKRAMCVSCMQLRLYFLVFFGVLKTCEDVNATECLLSIFSVCVSLLPLAKLRHIHYTVSSFMWKFREKRKVIKFVWKSSYLHQIPNPE